jgi:molybdopterin/thiamine biosynthesis adenylyltransferase
MPSFNNKRYEAQIEIIGEETWEALQNAKILIVGLGGLGSFVATELAYLGAKNLTLVDYDKVSASNLNRQILYTPQDVGKSKALVAVRKIKEINPDINVQAFDTKVTPSSASYLVRNADIVVDCSDNFETKKLLNKVCHHLKKTLISGGVSKWEGWVATFPFFKEDTPCLECLFPGDLETLKDFSDEPNQTLVVTVSAVANFQVSEVLILLMQEGETLESKTLIVDMKNYRFIPVKVNKNPKCPVCSTG